MIVVTGTTGNVGKVLVQALARAGDQVTAVSRQGPGPEPETDVQHVQADLADPETFRPVLDGAEDRRSRTARPVPPPWSCPGLVNLRGTMRSRR